MHVVLEINKLVLPRVRLFRALAALFVWCGLARQAYSLPSFARQTGQKCVACHVGGFWPQLTPWGRFFKLSGYTAGTTLKDKEGGVHIPVGVFGQAGLTWAAQPNDSNGQSVIDHNGRPEMYQVTGELGTKITNFLGLFYEYQVGNTFPGWKGTTNVADVRAVHFFHLGRHEILVGADTNNNPSVQDVWNSSPDWSYPFYSSPQAVSGPANPMITGLGSQSAGIGGYALVDRRFYFEVSAYRAATGFFRWMSAGISFPHYLSGYNPYWRAYWEKTRGAQSFLVGTFGLRASVYPDSSDPRGSADVFTDYGIDSQYQYLASTHKVTLRGNYIYERRAWDASFSAGNVGTQTGNLRSINVSGTYAYKDNWAFSAGYLLTNGNRDAQLYAVVSPSGDVISSSPKTTGYTLEIDRHITQNVQLMAQYRGFGRLNGLRHNVDGIGRNASDNNTLWLSVFFAF
ncbi:MAG: hypothetical protein JOY54_03570 [Acidobacteriaceae bacterium]|nr:hypothetical protein [Acidobacteriaceae bacterium]